MKKYDLVVVGGGISGVAAAVRARREGLSVLLIEKCGHLGGAMSNSLVYPFMSYSIGNGRLLSAGIFTEMRERFATYGEKSWEFYKMVFDDMTEEAGVEVLFHSAVFGVDCSDRRVKRVSVMTKSGILEVEADYFLDASGDGQLLSLAGCAFQLGRESDGLCQPMTTCFRLCNVDISLFLQELGNLNVLYEEAKKQGKISNPRENILAFVGLGDSVLHLNTTRVIKHNPIDPFELSNAERLARKQVLEMFHFLKEHSKACKRAELVAIAGEIGVRESRKLKGVHILTADELVNMTDFEDTIAVGNYEIDIHNPEGTGTTIHAFKQGDYYKIPYRSLLPKEYDNLLAAGRCLSATHEAHSAVRIMPICASLGEAAGMAIAVAKETGKNTHTLDVQVVRQRLKKVGAVVE